MQDIARLEQTPLDRRLQGLISTYDVIKRAARNDPLKTALHFLPQGTAEEAALDISYGQLFARVTQTANLFHDLGLGPNDVISFLLPNLPETHYILWGGEAAGIVNPLNPMLDVDHIVGIMKAAQSKILVTLGPTPGSDIFQKAQQVKDLVPSLKHVIQIGGDHTSGDEILNYQDIIDRYNADQLDSKRVFSPDDVCSLFHTGGTTGTPKLARHTHHNEISVTYMTAMHVGLSSDDVALCGLPLFHVNGAFVTGLLIFLLGATVVIATPGGFRTQGVMLNFWKIVEKYKVRFFSGVPTIYAGLLQVPIGDADVSSLRMAICGGAPMPRDIIRRFEQATGIILLEGYGMTEGTCVSSCNPLEGERRVGSIGFRLPYQEMKSVILDDQGHYVRDSKVDEIGSIVIKGPNVFSGYLQEEANQGIWLDGDWFNTGDMGRQDAEGYFWLTGRTKELIIRGGHNIDPAVIENALIKHEAVTEVAAVGKPDKKVGELPVAYVVLKAGSTATDADLIRFAASHISERAAVPKEIFLIEALPLTAVGKIFKPALKRDAIKRAVGDVLAVFNLEHNISVEPDKTYGTVATIEIDSAVPEQKINDIRHLLNQYTFHTKINKNQSKNI